MRKYGLLFAIVALVLGVTFFAAAAPRDEKPQNVILIGWDGCQRNHLKECLERGELPGLTKLMSEGTLVDIDVKGVTDTKAGWSQILTGYNPTVTGVYSNGKYQPVPKGYSIFERLRAFFGADKIFTAAIIGKSAHVDAEAPQKVKLDDEEKAPKGRKGKRQDGKIVEEDGVKYRVIPGKPYYYTKDGMDLWVNGLMLDKRVGDKALEVITQQKDKPFFLFVHFAEVDHKGHAFGENSKEYNDAIVSGDTQLGRIVAKLKELGLYDKTLIYVTADHGFDEGLKSHRDAPCVFLGTNDPKVTRAGLRADITPTILDRFGVDLEKVKPPLDGHSLLRPAPAKP
jgi:predicted AlkP superfamily pyrophosphatase or phosphodiesterase